MNINKHTKMLNPDLKLNPDSLNQNVEQVPIRKGFGEGLLIAGESDDRVVGLCADLTESTQMHLFKNKFPNRFVEIGVAEQNLAAVASGMAAMGKIPFISSYAMFSPGRNWEQIRTTICYNNRPVKIVGSHSGISVGPDGGTHQAVEDIAIMRVIPRMVVISPCDSIEARKATMAAAKTNDPTYIRLAREKTPLMTTNATPFNIGKAQIFWRPDSGVNSAKSEVLVVATGALVHRALLAALKLQSKNIPITVINVSTIKPLDEDLIWREAMRSKAVVTVEEHQIAGGLGGAVAECLVKHHPVPMEFIGVNDQFGQSGTPDELLNHYKMSVDDIVRAVEKVKIRKI